MNTHSTPSKPPGADGTIGKAVAVLDMVAQADGPMRFGQMLAQSDHPKATLYRLVQTLTNLGMLHYDEARQTYAPGLHLVQLAHAAWRQSSLAPVARPHIDTLASAVKETVHLAQMDAGQVIYVDKRNAADPIEMFSQAGKVGPGYCTGVGKAIMAFMEPQAQSQAIARQAFLRHTDTTLTSSRVLRAELDQIAQIGVAFDKEEHEPGIICIAAPIRTSAGHVIGALSVTTSTARKSLDDLALLAPDLKHTAKNIAQAAETWQFPRG